MHTVAYTYIYSFTITKNANKNSIYFTFELYQYFIIQIIVCIWVFRGYVWLSPFIFFLLLILCLRAFLCCVQKSGKER